MRRQAFRYGVGLGAYFAKTANAPEHRTSVLARLPRGVHYLLSSGSQKNEHRSDDFPRSLSALELLGIAWGPVAYARSRRQYGGLSYTRT